MAAVKKASIEKELAEYQGLGGDALLNASEIAGVDPSTIVNDSMYNIRKGMVVLKTNKDAKIQLGWWEDNPSNPNTISLLMSMLKDGWVEAMADDFWIHPTYRYLLRRDSNGRLTVAGRDQGTLVLFYRPKEAMDRALAYNRRFSDDIQAGIREQMEGVVDDIHRAGARVIFREETEINDQIVDRQDF